jgi:hypothetical protein
MNANNTATTNLSFQRDPPSDTTSTSTLNETFGAKYTVGDSIIKGIPRVYPKLPAYDKYSLLYQEGQVPNIRAECNQASYNTLLTSTEKELSLINCTMTYISPYEELYYPDITLSLAGQGSRGFKKRPFKVEITDASNPNEIYNRQKFKLRNMVYDCTYIKNKLGVDIGTSLGMASGQDGFARFYVNNQPFGLYDLFDPLKKKFIKQYFHPGETDPKLGVLFKGKTNSGIRYFFEVINELSSIYVVDMVPDGADELTYTGEEDIMELLNFVNNELDNASIERIKEVIDLDLLLKTFALEYLIDHRDGLLIGGNNFNIYKNIETGRYHIWSYDFDATFGKYQTYETNTPFDSYMIIPESYVSNRPAGEVRPKYNILAQKLFAKEEIKTQFNQILLDAASKVFNGKGIFGRIGYFQEFLMHHIYWDISRTPSLPTQHFTGTDAEMVYTLADIENGYNGSGYTCNGDKNGLYEYISIRSQTILNSLGGVVEDINVDTLSEDDVVGLPILKLADSDDDSLSLKSNSAINHVKLNISFILSLIVILFIH